MLARSLSVRVMSALVALVAANGCSLADDLGDPAGGGSNNGGSTGQAPATEVGYEETDLGDDPPRLGGGGDPGNDACDNGVRFEMAPNATHGRVSAAFAVAALEAGTWPDINRSLLRQDEFLAYFASSDSPEPFGRVRTTEDGERLDVFVKAPIDDQPTHLILVVDTSTSMRNDLPLAGAIVSGLADAVAASGEDYLTVVEWGSSPRVFTTEGGESTVPASSAVQLGVAFNDYAAELTKAQLGPGGSLGPAQSAVDAAIAAGPETPHIVVLTDGGVEADGDAFAAIESWATKRSAVISFIEIAGASSNGDSAQPRSYHREQLASMATAGGGLTHFVTDLTLPRLLADFEGSFRIGRRNVVPRYEMEGITSLIDSSEVDFAAGELGSGSVPRWSGRGRHVFTSVAVTTCGVQPFSGTVYLDDVPSAVEIGDQQDERVARLGQIDQLFEILRSNCDEAKPLITAFGQGVADADLQAWVDKAAALCEPPL